MECAFCQHEVEELDADEHACPACGQILRVEDAPGKPRVVEGSIEPGETLEELAYMPARDAAPRSRAIVPAVSAHPALVTLARLPARAWRQPAVRSAVKTGASAVALTLAFRLAGRLVVSRGGRQVARDGLLPLVAEMLQPREPERPERRRGRGSGEVSETLVYMRRTIRQ
jgi:hypothetical protein